MDCDILQVIPDEDLPKLRDIFKNPSPYCTHVYSLLAMGIEWKKRKPFCNYLKFMAVKGDWKTSGTFIVIMEHGLYNIFVFTLEKTCTELYKALTETKMIDWEKRLVILAVLEKHVQVVHSALQQLEIDVFKSVVTDIWRLPKEKALEYNINCPDEVYLEKLKACHGPLVNSLWPHRYKGSEKYISTMLEINSGFGLFLKRDNRLVAWILKNETGILGALQTVEDHKRKGYAALVTKAMSKEMAQEGFNPTAHVLEGNDGAASLFRNLGFQKTCLTSSYIILNS